MSLHHHTLSGCPDHPGESYNPTLLNVAGPWDRGYGFCMTQYFASIGGPIAALIGLDRPCETNTRRCRAASLTFSSHA